MSKQVTLTSNPPKHDPADKEKRTHLETVQHVRSIDKAAIIAYLLS